MTRSREEAEFQQGVLKLASWYGWLAYHTYDSRRSQAGFPDLVLVRGGVLIFAELKSTKGRVSKDQQKWIDALNFAEGVRCYVWRPADMDEIIALLSLPK